MITLVRKMNSFGILRVQMIVGAIIMAAAMILLPTSIAVGDASLLLNPFVLGVVLVGMLMFGSFAYFLFIRPYFTYQKSPSVLVEADDEFLYVYGKKQAKIPLSDLEDAYVDFTLPFLYSKEFIAMLFIHLSSERYGDIVLEVPGYGKFKLHFVADVQATAYSLARFIGSSGNGGAGNDSGVEEIIF